MNRVLNVIIIWSLFTISNIYSNPQNREVFNEYKEVDEVNENNKNNDEIEESEMYSSTETLSDAQRLDRLARGAEYVDRFDWLDSGKSQLVNAEDIKDFARDPSLSLVTTYGQDRIREENIKKNLFKTGHRSLDLGGEGEEGGKEPKPKASSSESPLFLQFMKKLGFVQKLIFY